jgi:hypothetical protein
VDLGVDPVVRRVVQQNSIEGNFVEECEHWLRRVCQKVCEDRTRVGQVNVRDFERFRVD